MPADPHILTVTWRDGGADPGEFDYEVGCPGVSDDCRAWEECARQDCSADDLWDTDGKGHGVEHRYIAGCWSLPLNQCYLQAYGDGMPEAIDDLHLSSGRHEITDVEYDGDFGTVDRLIVAPLVARARRADAKERTDA